MRLTFEETHYLYDGSFAGKKHKSLIVETDITRKDFLGNWPHPFIVACEFLDDDKEATSDAD